MGYSAKEEAGLIGLGETYASLVPNLQNVLAGTTPENPQITQPGARG